MVVKKASGTTHGTGIHLRLLMLVHHINDLYFYNVIYGNLFGVILTRSFHECSIKIWNCKFKEDTISKQSFSMLKLYCLFIIEMKKFPHGGFFPLKNSD